LGIGLLSGGLLKLSGDQAISPVSREVTPPSLQPIETKKNDLDFFIEYRLDRERTRGRQIELLREIINSPLANEQTRKKAQEEILAISDKLSKEKELEHLIRAKGYQEATICIAEKGVTVIVQPVQNESNKITPEEMTKICEVISWGTGFGEQNIIVISKT